MPILLAEVTSDSTVFEGLFGGLKNFVTGIWEVILQMVTNIGQNNVLSVYVWYIPLFSFALGLIFSIVGTRRRGRRR